MSSEAELVIDVWDAVRDHVPHGRRSDIARDLLYAFADYGFEPGEMASIVDEDPDLRDAFDEVFPEGDEDEVDE
jgi:hypothetical protein